MAALFNKLFILILAVGLFAATPPAPVASQEDGEGLSGPPKIIGVPVPPLPELLQKAQAGDVLAQFQLGEAYLKGLSLPQHFGKARQWFLRAANQGYPPAMLQAAELFVYGKGGDLDLAQAYYWYTLAAANGINIAVPRRDRLRDKLEPKVIEKAQDQAAEFKPRPEKGAKP